MLPPAIAGWKDGVSAPSSLAGVRDFMLPLAIAGYARVFVLVVLGFR